MPELPEVEVVVRGLRDLVIGHKVTNVKYDWPKGFPNDAVAVKKFLIGAKIIDISRRAKVILITLESNYTLAIHLKMTGQLVYVQSSKRRSKTRFGGGHPTGSLVGDLPDKTTRVILELDKGAKLFFNDMRKFGWLRLIPAPTLDQVNFLKKLGPDALTVEPADFSALMKRRQKTIKACLLDQAIVAGCGNIYADEALWLSQLHPQLSAKKIPTTNLLKLHSALQEVLKASIAEGGSSSKNYVNAKGQRGRYLDSAHVYQKRGDPCKRCQTSIERIVVATRGTHICPSCQRLPGKRAR